MKTTKPHTPPHVRKTYHTICAAKVTGKSNGRSLTNGSVQTLSHQIDTQRRLVLDLERELHWLNSEKLSLREQLSNIVQSIESLSAACRSARENKLKISQLSEAINSMCWDWLYKSNESASNAAIAIERLRGIDPRLRFPVHDSKGVVCACVVDPPETHTSLGNYIGLIERGINEIMGFSIPLVRIVHAQKDTQEKDALKVFFGVSRESGDHLAKEIGRLSSHSGEGISSPIKNFLEVARAVIIDTQPSLDSASTYGSPAIGSAFPLQPSAASNSNRSLNSQTPYQTSPALTSIPDDKPVSGLAKRAASSSSMGLDTPYQGSPVIEPVTPEQTSPSQAGFERYISAKIFPVEEIPEESEEDEDDASDSDGNKSYAQRPGRGSVMKLESPRSSNRSWGRKIAKTDSQSPKRGSMMSTMSKTRSRWGKSAVSKMGPPPAIPEPE